MKASELVKELIKRINLWGDYDVIIRIDNEDFSLDEIYYDEEVNKIVVTDYLV